MKMKFLFVCLSAIVLLSSCDNYGERIEFGKSEVYYKGKGVTEAQAKKLGDYLVEKAYITKEKAQSVQVEHDGKEYTVRFAYDKKAVTDNVSFIFWKLQYNLSKDVFENKPVRLALADNKLNDFEVMHSIAEYKIDKSLLLYDQSELKEGDAKKLADFFRGINVAGGANQALIFYQKKNDVPVVRVVVMEPKALTADNMMVFSYWQELLRENVYGAKGKLVLTSGTMEDLNPLPQLTAEQRQVFDAELNKNDYQYTEQAIEQ
jgi:Rad3-related DNA helicase